MALKCSYCGYVWNPRKVRPKACPRCKRFFLEDRPVVEVDEEIEPGWIWEQMEVGEVDAEVGTYIACAVCVNLGEDVEAVLRFRGESFCLRHLIEQILDYEKDMEYSKPDPAGDLAEQRERLRSLLRELLSESS